MTRLATRVLFILAVGLCACGHAEPAITNGAAASLDAQVTAARAAVASGDHPRAEQLLDGISASVDDLRSRGDVSEQRAGDIINAVDDVRAALQTYAATATTTTTTPPAATAEVKDERGHGRDKGKEDGHGGGNDD
jgi:hypothetical protein